MIKSSSNIAVNKENLIQLAKGYKEEFDARLPGLKEMKLDQKEIGSLFGMIQTYRQVDQQLKKVKVEPILKSTLDAFETELLKQEKNITDTIYQQVLQNKGIKDKQNAFIQAQNMIQNRIENSKKEAKRSLKVF